MKRARIVHADDHRMTTDSLQVLLERDFEHKKSVGDGRALIEAADEFHPDVIIADISMPLLNGIDAVTQVKRAHHEIKVVFLTMHEEVSYAVKAYEAGGSGYVLKRSSPDELVAAIRIALRGEKYIPPMLAGPLIECFHEKASDGRDEAGKLTSREREVLQLLAEGLCAKQTASILGISPRTVEFHKYRLMEGLGIKTSAELVRFAVKHGIVS